jgi:hypothetical protein
MYPYYTDKIAASKVEAARNIAKAVANAAGRLPGQAKNLAKGVGEGFKAFDGTMGQGATDLMRGSLVDPLRRVGAGIGYAAKPVAGLGGLGAVTGGGFGGVGSIYDYIRASEAEREVLGGFPGMIGRGIGGGALRGGAIGALGGLGAGIGLRGALLNPGSNRAALGALAGTGGLIGAPIAGLTGDYTGLDQVRDITSSYYGYNPYMDKIAAGEVVPTNNVAVAREAAMPFTRTLGVLGGLGLGAQIGAGLSDPWDRDALKRNAIIGALGGGAAGYFGMPWLMDAYHTYRRAYPTPMVIGDMGGIKNASYNSYNPYMDKIAASQPWYMDPHNQQLMGGGVGLTAGNMLGQRLFGDAGGLIGAGLGAYGGYAATPWARETALPYLQEQWKKYLG